MEHSTAQVEIIQAVLVDCSGSFIPVSNEPSGFLQTFSDCRGVLIGRQLEENEKQESTLQLLIRKPYCQAVRQVNNMSLRL